MLLKNIHYGGNSGIQYRSQDLGGFHVSGYQADMESGKNHSGILYEQGGRGIVTKRGERITVNEAGGKEHGQPVGTSTNLQSAIKSEDWMMVILNRVPRCNKKSCEFRSLLYV